MTPFMVAGTGMGLAVRNLRWWSLAVGVSNLAVVLMGGLLILRTHHLCPRRFLLPFLFVSLAAPIRVVVMFQTAFAQQAAATLILQDSNDLLIRLRRRAMYKKWLCWNRCSAVVIVLQSLFALFLLLDSTRHSSTSNHCLLDSPWNHGFLAIFIIFVSFLAVLQCFTGSDVIKWRSFYEARDHAWKSHYSEVFDNGIPEEDEVYSVARLLGDLVAYRASGTGHLELLAALALLQNHEKSTESYEESMEAPEMRIKEAEALHKFAEAAYTGPLLDVGRNPFVFPCAWLYRQGVFSPWTRNRWHFFGYSVLRRPILDGDNWWRGHAAAFLKYTNLPPEVLRQGRVNQVKCEAAYFVVVLHHLQSVVIAIRGTETPEDLITDGLCKECSLSADDLAGLINLCPKNEETKWEAYGGIVEAARELFMQIEGHPERPDSESYGLLSKLLGFGCECFGYNVRIVGHSLGGAIAALLGLQVFMKVYYEKNIYEKRMFFASLENKIVDANMKLACIIFGNEFSSRLSIGSVMRLRAAAITSLSQDPKADSAMIFRLARRFLYLSKYQRNKTKAEDESEYHSGAIQDNLNHQIRRSQCDTDNKGALSKKISIIEAGSIEQELHNIKGNLVISNYGEYASFESEDCLNNEHEECSLWSDARARDHIVGIDNARFTNAFAKDARSIDDPVSQFIDTVPDSENPSSNDPPELYLPGFVIHIVLEKKRSQTDLRTSWRMQEREKCYRAYIADRESFKDIIVSPSMFLDHLPWRGKLDSMKSNIQIKSKVSESLEWHGEVLAKQGDYFAVRHQDDVVYLSRHSVYSQVTAFELQ
ncbi:unnamed protein product [Sphenostylis stenocarpa]|uniref:Fungal lipase-like domain-containing protein n=1 Tax=Sphenostylis stenocarpa TaxID=92480 RepID=A0AA87BA47_9FABA|nr:unnamed protein product [Sphenostylis stenocarpa]